MLYILFNSREDLERFLLNELIDVDCPDKCFRACFEGYRVYRLKELNVSIEVVVRRLSDDILSVFPCDSYDGMGFIVGSKISELIRQYYSELVNYIVNIVRRYFIDFLSITSMPLELSSERSIYSYSLREFLNLVYAFYTRDLSESFLYNVTSRSCFANTLIYTLSVQVVRDPSIILNTHVPLNVKFITHLFLTNFENMCKRVFRNIASDRDLLCLLYDVS